MAGKFGSSMMRNQGDFGMKEFPFRVRTIRDSTGFASNFTSFRDDGVSSFRSNMTLISSGASSPGYTFGGETDTSAYSFTTALKELQEKSIYSWEYLSPDHEDACCSTVNSHQHISKQRSLTELLSANPHLASRITVSAPLVYPSHSKPFHSEQNINSPAVKVKTRDVGTQCTDAEATASAAGKLTGDKQVKVKERWKDNTKRKGAEKVVKKERKPLVMRCICITVE